VDSKKRSAHRLLNFLIGIRRSLSSASGTTTLVLAMFWNVIVRPLARVEGCDQLRAYLHSGIAAFEIAGFAAAPAAACHHRSGG